jgi:hypothetical protein
MCVMSSNSRDAVETTNSIDVARCASESPVKPQARCDLRATQKNDFQRTPVNPDEAATDALCSAVAVLMIVAIRHQRG